MRWLRFAALGALLPLALFALLANCLKPCAGACGLGALRAHLVRFQARTNEAVYPGRVRSAPASAALKAALSPCSSNHEFDVSDTGVVENAHVIDSAPNAVFEASALRAVERSCYRPAIEDGRAVARRALRARVRFETHGATS